MRENISHYSAGIANCAAGRGGQVVLIVLMFFGGHVAHGLDCLAVPSSAGEHGARRGKSEDPVFPPIDPWRGSELWRIRGVFSGS